MPLNNIVSEATARQGGDLIKRGNAPEEDNAPDGEPAATTMNTGPMLPPYLHNQTLSNRGGLFMLTTVTTLLGILKVVMDNANR